MVLGPEQHSRQGLYRQCCGPSGRQVEPLASRNAASIAALACMGNSVEFAQLEMASQQSIEEMHGQLWEPIRAGLDLPLGTLLYIPPRPCPGSGVFLDSGRSARRGPSRIGRRLSTCTAPEEEKATFEIVNQFNRGGSLIRSQQEREKLAELNLIAGKRAKASIGLSLSNELFRDGHGAARRGLLGAPLRAHFRTRARSVAMRISNRRVG